MARKAKEAKKDVEVKEQVIQEPEQEVNEPVTKSDSKVLIKTINKLLVGKISDLGFEVVHMHGGVMGGLRKIFYMKGMRNKLSELSKEEREFVTDAAYAEINEHLTLRKAIKEDERKSAAVTKVHPSELVPSKTY
jgi:hypothetical protein